MRKNLGVKHYIYPQPVFIISTYNADGTPDAMNAAWGGVSDADEVTICVGAGHKTAKNLLSRKAFCLSMADVAHVAECDYLGITSGNDIPDKLFRANLHTTASTFVDAPLIDELPLAFECKVVSYDLNSRRLVGKIINVSADEKILSADGKIDLSVFEPITFDAANSVYVKLGEKVAPAFTAGKIFQDTKEK